MVKSYTVALAATAILFSVAPALAYDNQYQYEARDLADYSEHMARDLSDFYLAAREPDMDLESLYARDDKKDKKQKRPLFWRPRRKSRKSKLVVLKKTCAALSGKDKDQCTKEFKEINKKTTEVLKKYRKAAKKAKADKKKKEEEERKKKKAEEEKKKKEEAEKKKKEEAEKKKKEDAEKKKKEEEEKKKKKEEEEKKKNNKREDDDLEARDGEVDFATYVSYIKRGYVDGDLEERSYFDSIDELD